MKRISPFFSVLFILLVVTLFSCKDSEDGPAPETRSRKELLMLGTWKLTASVSKDPVDIDGLNGASTDVFSQLKPCETDNTYTFNKDSTITEVNNTKCKSNEAATYKGSWLLSADGNTLTWDGSPYPVMEISATRMVLKYSFVVGSTTYELTDTYSH